MKRFLRFLSKPWADKVQSLKYRWLRFLPVPLPVRLRRGIWWLAENDYCGATIALAELDSRESAFVESFLRPGMNILDIGAHHGFYTLLASARTGPTGQVLAFEPSPRERKRLRRHLHLNRCTNVTVQECALGSTEGIADLFVVEDTETGCNSLRPPNVPQSVKAISVKVSTIDRCLELAGIDRVDFVKLDVEGAEIEVLKGAPQLLKRKPRPVMMCEVEDVRTSPWGYPAKLIIEFLAKRDYHWFALSTEAQLTRVPTGASFDGNYIAIPDERIDMLNSPSELGGTRYGG
jgi:FkbM family methyltransferase